MTVVNLRGGDGSVADTFASRDQRERFLQRREQARRALTVRFAVGLGERVRLPNGRVLTELQPIGPRDIGSKRLRELVDAGVVLEGYHLPEGTDEQHWWPPPEPPPPEAA